MIDRPDDGLCDTQLLEEIELLTGVIIAATSSAGRLPLGEIDEVLGVVREVDPAPAGTASRIPEQQSAFLHSSEVRSQTMAGPSDAEGTRAPHP